MALVWMYLPHLELVKMALGEMDMLHLELSEMVFQCRTFCCGQAYDRSYIFYLNQFDLTNWCSSSPPMPPTFFSFLVFQASSLLEVAQHLTFCFLPHLFTIHWIDNLVVHLYICCLLEPKWNEVDCIHIHKFHCRKCMTTRYSNQHPFPAAVVMYVQVNYKFFFNDRDMPHFK